MYILLVNKIHMFIRECKFSAFLCVMEIYFDFFAKKVSIFVLEVFNFQPITIICHFNAVFC